MADSTQKKPGGTANRKVFSPKFRLGFIIYALIFIIAGSLLLLFLWNYLDSYERSQSQTVVKNFCSALTPDQVTDILTTSVTDSPYEDVREIVKTDYAQPFCESDKTYIRNINESDSDHVTYIVSGANRKLLRVKLESEAGGAGFGRNLWKVQEISAEDGWLTGTHSIQCAVPETAKLLLNGVEVGSDAAILNDIVYPGLRPSEQSEFGEFTVYRVSGLLREPEVSVAKADGTPITLTATAQNLLYYMPAKIEFHSITVSLPRGAQLYVEGYQQELTGTPQPFFYKTTAYEPADLEAAAGSTYVLEGFAGVPELEAVLDGRYLKLEKPDDNTYVFAYPEDELYTLTLTVPKGAEVTIGGTALAETLTYSEVPNVSFKGIEKYVDAVPETGECVISGFFSLPEVNVTLNGKALECGHVENGKALTYTYSYPQGQPDSERQTAVATMTDAYLTYASHGRVGLDENYSRVIDLMVYHTDSWNRMCNTYDAYYWVNGYVQTYEQRHEITSFIPYGDNLFEVTVNFYVHTLRHTTEVESSGNIRMVFVKDSYGWHAGYFEILS